MPLTAPARTWTRRVLAVAVLTIAGPALLSGCGKSAVSQLRTSTPAEAAAHVMESHDANQDGKLSAAELAASPALIDGLARIDADGDGAVSLAEIEARFGVHDQMSDAVAIQVRITAKGAPLTGAQVTFIPEPFMGEGKQSYVGVTNASGDCHVQGQDVPMPGVPTGYYKVHIVHEATGTDVTRGVEIADDTPSPNRLTLDTQQPAAPKGRGR